MKAVLMSIRPEWCKKILSGEKTVEIRKTRPALMLEPFKVYIYCTATWSGNLFTDILIWNKDEWNRWKYLKRLGRVIGEFTCSKVDVVQRHGAGDNFDYCYLSPNVYSSLIELRHDDVVAAALAVKNSCVHEAELNAYGKSAPELFAWHISDLKIYDNPKPLSCFSKHGFSSLFGTSVCGNEDCKYYEPSGDRMVPPTCGLNGYCSLHRPPQSWCYVEELKDETILPVLLQRLSER